MNTWTNQARNPSRLGDRSDRALGYAMGQLNIPDCGLQTLRDGINSDTPMAINMTSTGGSAGLWNFYPIMGMSYNKGGIDYTQTTVLQEGLVARGRYIPIHCGEESVHVAYFPKCGNIATLAKQSGANTSTTVVFRNHTHDKTNTVPIPGTLGLILLGVISLLALRRFK